MPPSPSQPSSRLLLLLLLASSAIGPPRADDIAQAMLLVAVVDCDCERLAKHGGAKAYCSDVVDAANFDTNTGPLAARTKRVAREDRCFCCC